MTTYGLTPTGLVIKTVEVVRSDLDSAMRSAFGPSIPLGDLTLLGQIDGILAERYAELWSLAQQVYSAMDPDAANGSALEALCSLTGTFRQPATFSKVTVTCCGTPTTNIPANSQASTISTGAVFQTTQIAVIVALTAWVITTAYIVGDRRTNAGLCFQCSQSGVSAGSGGPSTKTTGIVDGTAHWDYIGDGTGAVDVVATSVLSGAIAAVSRDILGSASIVTPISGWSTVVNLLDAVQGQKVQTDQSLRLTRNAELSEVGSSTANAIRAAIFVVTGVTSATVFYNNTDTTNSDGMPPHSVEALVLGGADQDILNALFANVAAGIAFRSSGSGAVVGSVVDSQGTVQTVQFTRPSQLLMYDDITLTYDPAVYVPATSDAAVKVALASFGNAQATGKDSVASALASAILPVYVSGVLVSGVAGVLDVSQVLTYSDVLGATPGSVAWAPTTAYVATPGAPSVVSNFGRVYVCIVAGTSNGSGGPSTTAASIPDGAGSLVWRYLGATFVITTRQLAVHDTSRIAVHSTAGSV